MQIHEAGWEGRGDIDEVPTVEKEPRKEEVHHRVSEKRKAYFGAGISLLDSTYFRL